MKEEFNLSDKREELDDGYHPIEFTYYERDVKEFIKIIIEDIECKKIDITENCYREYTNCKIYQEKVCYAQREIELKQANLEKMILNLKKRLN